MSNGSRTFVSSCTVGLVAYLAASLAMPRQAHAQFSSAIDLSSRSANPTPNGWQSLLAISPFARFDHPRTTVDARWTALGGDGRRLDGVGNFSATYFSPTFSGLQLSIGGFADRTLLNETFAVSRLGTDSRVSYRRGNSGAWIGKELSRDNKSTPLSAVPRVSAGTWRQWGNTVMTVSMSSFGSRTGPTTPSTHTVYLPYQKPAGVPDTGKFARTIDTVTVTDSGGSTPHDWNDAEVSLHWSAGRLAFRGMVGTRLFTTTVPNETWGQVQGTLALAPDIALIASSGIHPASAAYGISRSRFVELGFRVAPSALLKPRLPSSVRPTAAAFEVAEGARGQRTLRVRVPNARTVELSGDFTNWKPIALARADGDRWEATLLIPPGIHRLAIRVDGDSWSPPPGVSSVSDEFQGNVGVIVVR
ncbi:MAG TPA: glycogen-binding domain-containing protein [Gemmatimonadaceae bacterium]|nr:glycogen-binding domain-containing protein [Gemmatimonadaceae bacterium]